MKRLIPQLKLCAVATAIAGLAACGGGDTTTDECVATDLALAPSTTASTATSPTPAPAPTPSSSSDDGDDRDDDEGDDNDGDDARKKAAACPAPATSAAPAPAPAASDSGSPTPAPSPSPSPAPSPAPAPAPAPAPVSSSAAVGKSLYASSCASCHGSDPTKNQSKILKGTSASSTLSAIASNKGGMGFLSSSIGSQEAQDIAAYLAAP